MGIDNLQAENHLLNGAPPTDIEVDIWSRYHYFSQNMGVVVTPGIKANIALTTLREEITLEMTLAQFIARYLELTQ
jgi:hypothetical protein